MKNNFMSDIYSRVLSELYLANILLPGLPSKDKYKTLNEARKAEPMLASIIAKLTDNELTVLIDKIENLL